jgi:hypothetical protein
MGTRPAALVYPSPPRLAPAGCLFRKFSIARERTIAGWVFPKLTVTASTKSAAGKSPPQKPAAGFAFLRIQHRSMAPATEPFATGFITTVVVVLFIAILVGGGAFLMLGGRAG